MTVVPLVPMRFATIFWFIVSLVLSEDQDLYMILGVSKTATTKEIKSAYRRKALDTHPDKNKNVPPEQAAEAFHKVVSAFEILSDASSRQHYDRTGTKPGQQQQQQQQGRGFQSSSFTWTYHFKKQSLKDKFEVKEAQSRVMHIVSLEQLQTVMLDDNELLERNLLMVFVTPPVEAVADDTILFPYPFAAMSPQRIWWEDLLQTVKVRFHKENDLTKFFGIDHGDVLSKSNMPIFVFGRRGHPLSGAFSKLQTNVRADFEAWMWKQISLGVRFTNHHDHEDELYWVHGSTAKITMKLQPQESSDHTTMLSHEWYVRDARVDTLFNSPNRNRLTTDSSLISWKIVDDKIVDYVIPKRTCFDLSGHCPFWKHQGECTKNPDFMREQCLLTCRFCSRKDDEKLESLENEETGHDEL